jgi:hypothetical protein
MTVNNAGQEIVSQTGATEEWETASAQVLVSRMKYISGS